MKFKPEIGAKINVRESLNIPASDTVGFSVSENMLAVYSTRAKHNGDYVFQFHPGEKPHMELIEMGDWDLRAEIVKTDIDRPFISFVAASPTEKETPQYRPEV